MSIERGKDLLAGIFANYGIDINTWATYSPEKQRQMASDYKNNKSSEQLDDQPPYESQYGPDTEPSSMQGFLKKTRLHDPQGAAALMNAENTPVQTDVSEPEINSETRVLQPNIDVSESEIIPETRGLKPRLAVPQVGLMAKRIAYNKAQEEKLITRLAIEKRAEKKRKAEEAASIISDETTYDEEGNPLTLSKADQEFVDNNQSAAEFSGLSSVGGESQVPREYTQDNSPGNPALKRSEAEESNFGETVWNSLFGDPQKTINKLNFDNTPVSRKPKDKDGKATIEAFTEEEDARKAKTKVALDTSKKVRDAKIKARKKRKEAEGGLSLTDTAKLYGLAYLQSKGAPPAVIKKIAAQEGTDEEYTQDNSPGNPANKKAQGFIDLNKDAVQEVIKKKQETANGFVDYDENGYPIYKKSSSFGKSFRDAHAKANGKEFSWKGHDGKTRKYSGNKSVEKILEDDNDSRMGQLNAISTEATTPEAKVIATKKVLEKVKKVEDKKELISAEKESRSEGSDLWTDPISGWVVDRGKNKKARELVEQRKKTAEQIRIVGLLEPSDRIVAMARLNLISSEDLKAILEPTELEKLESRKKDVEWQIKASQLSLNKMKIENYMSPEKTAHYKGFNDAIKNNNPQAILAYGNRLKFSSKELSGIISDSTKAALSKVSGKEKDRFKRRFQIPYEKIYTSKEKIMGQLSSFSEEGLYGKEITIGTTTYKGRKGIMAAFKLKESDALTDSNTAKNYFNDIRKNHGLEFNRFFKNPKYQTDGKPNIQKLIKNPMAYEEFLQNILLNAHMEKVAGGVYAEMERYRFKLMKEDQARHKELNRKLTATTSQ